MKSAYLRKSFKHTLFIYTIFPKIYSEAISISWAGRTTPSHGMVSPDNLRKQKLEQFLLTNTYELFHHSQLHCIRLQILIRRHTQRRYKSIANL